MKKPIQNKKLWIIIACVAAALLIIAGAVTAVLLLTGESEEAISADSTKIYWNIDRQIYFGKGEGGSTGRELDMTDGYYHVLLAADGRPIERKARSLTVVNKIDNLDAMGIVIDEKTRAITDVVPIEEISGGYLCRKFYVDAVNGTEITANSSSSFLGKEMKIKLKTTTPIYDVSLQALSDAGMPVKLESIERKDQITVILNKDNSIYAVYIVKRSRTTPIYWNIERKYDKKYSETTRTPDADGVYHILMAVGGKQVTVKCKDKQVVNMIDSRGNRSCGLEFDEEGFVVDSISALKCTGGKSVASWFDIMSMDGLEFVAEKHSETARDNGKRLTATLSPDCEVYNVSNNTIEFIGEATELKVSDRVQGFSDPTGQVVVMFVVNRWKTGNFYWNAYRMWDSEKKCSTRTRSKDGYFHFIMLFNGKEVDYKTSSAAIAEKVDSIASRSMGLSVSGDIITDVITPGMMYNSKGSWYDVEQFVDSKTIHVKKNSVTASDYGKEYDIKLADDCKIYNTTQFYTDHLGEETTLRVGDRIQGWVDYTGKAKIIYIVGRKVTNPLTSHNSNHSCKDCGKNVSWTAWTSGSSLPTTSGHYYLCGDVVSPQASIKENQNVVLCLNGHSIRASGKRIFATYEQGSSLTIDDCVGTGKVYSKYSGNLGTTQGAIIWARYGNVKLFGGTYIAPTGKTENVGPVIATNSNVNVYIENCNIIGGKTSKNGGAIYIGAGSKTTLTLKNTTVTAGKTDTGRGDAIVMSSKSVLNLKGKVVISGSNNNLYLASGALVKLDKDDPLTEGSKIGVDVVSANGKITSNYLSGVEQYFESNKSGYIVEKSSSYIFLDKKNALTAHKNPVHKCEDCGSSTKWTPWQSSTSLPTESGHYYLCGDVVCDQATINKENQDVVICLNGYTVRGTGNRILALNAEGARLTLTDCGEGTGKMYNSKSSGDFGTTQGSVIWVRKGTLNIYGGTYQATTATLPGGGGAICDDGSGNSIVIKNATIIGGATKMNGGAISANGKLTLENVTVKGGKADGKGNGIYIAKNGTLSLGGNVNVEKQIHLGDGALIKFTSSLTEGSSIKVKTDTANGRISDNYIEGVENYITAEQSFSVSEVGNQLYIHAGTLDTPEHASAHTCKDCGQSVTWQPWIEKTSLPKTSGHYYLCYDVTLSGQHGTSANQNVVICLNGKTVSCNNNRVIAINADNTKLTIDDCTGFGKLVNTKSSGNFGTTQGSVIWVRKGTLNIFGGTYQATTATLPGNGGTICDDGGNTVVIKNATIVGCKTEHNGGAIYSNGKLTLEDVTITGGSADGKGDAVYMAKDKTLAIGGKVSIENQVYLDQGAYITFTKALTSGSNIGADVANTDGKITTNYESGAEAFFLSQRTGIDIKKQDGALYYNLSDEDEGKHKHAVYGTTASAADKGVSSTRFIYSAVATEDELYNAINNATAGTPVYIYLDADIALTKATTGSNSSNYFINLQTTSGVAKWNNGKDKKIFLCLNGHTLSSYNDNGTATIKLLQLNASGLEFSICDCGETKGGLVCTREYTGSGSGGIVIIASGAKLNLYGVNLINGSAQNGGAICVASGTLNAYECNITGGSAETGLIYLTNANSTANLYDCSVTGATAGYGVYMANEAKSPKISGKTVIKDNAAGNIYIPTGKTVTFENLTDGSIIGVTATENTNFAESDGDYSGTCDIHSDNSAQTVSFSGGYYKIDAITAGDGKHTHAVYGTSVSAASHGVSADKYEYTAVATEDELYNAINNATAGTPVYIYLDDNIALTKATTGSNSSNYFINLQTTSNVAKWNSGKDKKIFLCLNGHTLSSYNDNGTATIKLLQLNASGLEFSICDCGETKGGLVCTREYTTSGSGGIVYIASGAKLNLYDVNLINGSAQNGGAICVASGTLNAYGCDITGGSAETGLIYLTNANSTANLYDCSVTGATAGYGVYMASAAKSPKISGKTVIKDNAAGNVYIPAGKTVVFESLAAGSEIGITYPDKNVAFATSDSNYTETCTVFSDNTAFAAAYSSGGYIMTEAYVPLMYSSFTGTAVNSKLSVLSPALNLLRKVGK